MWFDDYTTDLTLPKEWEDQSYKNDVCPSWVYKNYRIFINHYQICTGTYKNTVPWKNL